MVGSATDLAPHVAYCLDFANSLSYHDVLFVFGAPAEQAGLAPASATVLGNAAVPPSIAASVYDAMFGNACPFVGHYGQTHEGITSPFVAASCEAFKGGLLLQCVCCEREEF
jgi:hypothetical protein